MREPGRFLSFLAVDFRSQIVSCTIIYLVSTIFQARVVTAPKIPTDWLDGAPKATATKESPFVSRETLRGIADVVD